MAEPAQQQAGVINTEQAARLLMIGPERVRQLVKAGWINKIEKDRFHLVDVVQGYIKFRNSEDRRSSKTAADSRVRDARAHEIELRVAIKMRDLMRHDEHVEILDEVVGLFRSELSGLPARVTRDLHERVRIEQAVNEILDRISSRATNAAQRLAAPGGGADQGSVGDDARPLGQ
jgi:hypothetical protein